MSKAKTTKRPPMDKNAALLQILKKRKKLTPENVVEEAKNPKHPLHSLFCWDDTEAAKRYRELQAGKLIRHCKIDIAPAGSEQRVTVRAFVNVREEEDCGEEDDEPINKNAPGHYVPMRVAIEDEHYRKQIIDQALSDLQAFESKYQAFKFLEHAVESIKQTAKKLKAV